MRNLLNKYKDLQPISDDKTTQAIAEELMGLPDKEMEKFFAGNERAGAVFLYESPNHKGKVLELVMGMLKDDHISTLFVPHPKMGTRQSWLDLRVELIEGVEKVFNAPKGLCAIMDHSRARHVALPEFSTAQLYDLIADSERLIELPR